MKLLPYVIVLGLGAIGGASVRGLEPRTAAQGTTSQWEYASVEFSEVRGTERVLVCVFRDNGCASLPETPAPQTESLRGAVGVPLALDARVVAAIARLGVDGWELVGDGVTGRCEACTRFYFKRSRPRSD